MLVHRHADADATVLRELHAGMEEEGVPTREVVLPHGSPDAVAMAHAAATDSRLEVGIGVDAAGAVAVHHGKLPARRAVLVVGAGAGPVELRRAGRTAGRVVKGLPLG
ncbi:MULTISPECIES: glycerol dehydratase reactivase beta/small subunit family protein [unclassified Blastococcus]